MRANGVLRAVAMSGLHGTPLPPAAKWRLARYISGRLESSDSPRLEANLRAGLRMLLDLGESYERTMYYSGLYNPWLTLVFRQLLSLGDMVVDGGANIGYFTLLASKCVGSSGNVYVFEPIPSTYEALLDNLHLNDVTQAHPNLMALSNDERDLQFYLPADVQTGRPLGRLATAMVNMPHGHFRAKSTTLDIYTSSAGIQHVKLVKLDVEGSEVAAIEGTRQLLSEHRIDYLICELNTTLLDASGIRRSAMRDSVGKFGYRACFIQTFGGYKRQAGVHFVPVSQMSKPDTYGDYLFVAPGVRVPPW